MPCGISPETPNDSESGRRNDCISLLPLRRESMKPAVFKLSLLSPTPWQRPRGISIN
jgi:hypothetical protein